MHTTQDHWLRRFSVSRSHAGPHLILCPHAGAGASSQRELSDLCAPWCTPSVVQYPGRQDRIGRTPARSITDIADAVARELAAQPAADTRELVIFGHSMGALVAFELARSCGREGLPVAHLVVSAAVPPHAVAAEPRHPVTDRGIIDRLVGLAGTDDAILADPDLVSLAIGALRADYAMTDSYGCGKDAAVSCPISVLGGDSDPIVPFTRLWGWRAHTTADCSVSLFRGGHFYLSTQLPAVAEFLGRACTPVAVPVP
ncbi:thioesterase II family protein [Corynebacterium freneyi]|uniref:Thioesterase TesA n=1 Tax=Corynebacterium freneyi TaxID=134034 RepID=A0ABS4UAH8_9CORY|nr:alpha/beta fold hydrolase [Corynebacterium freneyi]MBP2333560.1 surfactin synthase thioesterase subunit [Corynebacterium freneyi]MCG7438414.1 alpha/beta fold hydrolase [Corynebacterium freneyi]QXA52416.1 alpha/beta fold hydrolase [Corynebacterium freneyi]